MEDQAVPRIPDEGFSRQKYHLLNSQHDALQRHLGQINTTLPRISSPLSSRNSSISPALSRSSSFSPTVSRNSYFSPSSSPRTSSPPHLLRHQRTNSFSGGRRSSLRMRRSSLGVDDGERLGEALREEEKLREVNLLIKGILMDLLGCEGAKGESGGSVRRWVQGRLMEVEKEIRGGRSRRRQGSRGD